jgi:uncharacterized protein (DUF169 family)
MELKMINQALDYYIRPGTFPVAVKMVSSADEIPQKARMPKRDLGMPMTVCQGIALARRYGWLLAMGIEDMLCPPAAVTLGFLPAKDKFLDGSFRDPPWVTNQHVRAKIAQYLPRLELRKYTHLVAAPLNRAEFEPQVIIVYGNPAQIARLIQATVVTTGGPIASSSTGCLVCAEEITKPIMTDECQFIVASGGDRAIAQTQDDEMSFSIPISKATAIVTGLEETHKAGARYPTLSFLTFEAEFPPGLAELMDYLRQGS